MQGHLDLVSTELSLPVLCWNSDKFYLSKSKSFEERQTTDGRTQRRTNTQDFLSYACLSLQLDLIYLLAYLFDEGKRHRIVETGFCRGSGRRWKVSIENDFREKSNLVYPRATIMNIWRLSGCLPVKYDGESWLFFLPDFLNKEAEADNKETNAIEKYLVVSGLKDENCGRYSLSRDAFDISKCCWDIP